MLFVVSFISIRHFLFSVYISVCILYIVGSMFAIILCQIVTLPCGTVVSTDITLTETARAAKDAAEHAQRAETRAEELETRRLGEETDGPGGEAEASLEIERLRAAARDHERSLMEVQQELAEQGTRLGEEERRNRAGREDLLQRAELEYYREQRQKWETRFQKWETRLIARLEAVEEELGARGDSTSRAADNEHLKEQLRSLASDLQAVQCSLW